MADRDEMVVVNEASEFDSVSVAITDDDGLERKIVTVEKLKGASRQGISVARDDEGYFHVVDDGNGAYRPLYPERYRLVGQFRNGIAYARKNGGWIAIDVKGRHIGLFANVRR